MTARSEWGGREPQKIRKPGEVAVAPPGLVRYP